MSTFDDDTVLKNTYTIMQKPAIGIDVIKSLYKGLNHEYILDFQEYMQGIAEFIPSIFKKGSLISKKNKITFLEIMIKICLYASTLCFDNDSRKSLNVSTSLIFHRLGTTIDYFKDFSRLNNFYLLYKVLKLEYKLFKILPKSDCAMKGYFCMMDKFKDITNIPKDKINRVFTYNLHITGQLVKRKYNMKNFENLVINMIINTFDYYANKSIDFYDVDTNNKIIENLRENTELHEMLDQLNWLYNKCVVKYT